MIENVQPLMEKIIQELILTVVQKCEHQFEKDNMPYGCTMMYFLSESHLSIHTFVDEGKISIDLFTCCLGTDFDKLRYIISDYYDIMYYALIPILSTVDIKKHIIITY